MDEWFVFTPTIVYNTISGLIWLAFFNHLLRGVPACSALLEKWNALFFTKGSKKRTLFREVERSKCPKFEERRVKNRNCALLLDVLAYFGYTARIPLFSRISPNFGCFFQILDLNSSFLKWVSNNFWAFDTSLLSHEAYLKGIVLSKKPPKKHLAMCKMLQIVLLGLSRFLVSVTKSWLRWKVRCTIL